MSFEKLPHSYRTGTRPAKKKIRRTSASRPRLSDEQIVEIREAAAAGEKDAVIAVRYGISAVSVGNIRRGSTRPNSPGPITIRKPGFK